MGGGQLTRNTSHSGCILHVPESQSQSSSIQGHMFETNNVFKKETLLHAKIRFIETKWYANTFSY